MGLERSWWKAVLLLSLFWVVVGLVCFSCSFLSELSSLTFGEGFFWDTEVIERPLFNLRERHRVREFMMPDGTGEEGAIIVTEILIVVPEKISLEAVYPWAIHDGYHGEGVRLELRFKTEGRIFGGDIHKYGRSGLVISETESHQ